MHRVIMKPRPGRIVHHRDHHGLNNRRDNLIACTRRQHQACRGPIGAHRRFVGVYRHGNLCEARIRHHGNTYYLGYFKDEIEAARARDRKAYELCGDLACLNIPEDLPRLRRLYPDKHRPKPRAARKARS